MSAALVPDPEVVREFATTRPDEPVAMLNLLAFVPDGRAHYLEYIERLRPIAEGVGARIEVMAPAETPLVGDDGWDMVLIVRYPSRRAFMAMATHPDYPAIHAHRARALARTALIPLIV